MALLSLLRTLEHCALRALPALHKESYDGWVVRMAEGGPKRAHSVNVIDASTLPLLQKIAHCEDLYGGRPTFRLPGQDTDPGLGAALSARGYRRFDESMVMLCDIAAMAGDADALTALPPQEWFAQLHEIDQGSAERKRVHVDLLSRLALPALYGARSGGGRYVAIGLAVIDGSYVGLFDIATRAESQRQGHARALVSALLQGARAQGAQSAYLQVGANNRAAIALYAALGFEECYRYSYWTAP